MKVKNNITCVIVLKRIIIKTHTRSIFFFYRPNGIRIKSVSVHPNEPVTIIISYKNTIFGRQLLHLNKKKIYDISVK